MKTFKVPAQFLQLTLLVAVVLVLVLAMAYTFVPHESSAAVVEAVRKSSDESVVGDDVAVQNDDELVLSLVKNRTYVIDGAIMMQFAGYPGSYQRIAFTAPAGATMKLGFIDSKGVIVDISGADVLQSSGGVIEYQVGDNLRRPIFLSGTVEMGSTSGDLTFQWGHVASPVSTTTVEAGSFLRADQI